MVPALLCAGLLTGWVDAAPFDYHTVRGRLPKAESGGIYEGEHLRMPRGGRLQEMGKYRDHAWSGGAHLLWHGQEVGASMETGFVVRAPGNYRVTIRLTQATDYGIFSVALNGETLAESVDLYASKVQPLPLLELGEHRLPAGEQTLAFTLTGGNRQAVQFRGSGYLLGLDYVKLTRLDPPEPTEGKGNQTSTDDRDAPATAPEEADPLSFDQARSIMAEHCFRCHGEEKTKGKVDLESLTTRAALVEDSELAQRVADAVAFGDMPPEDEKRLPPAKRTQLVAWFNRAIDEHLAGTPELAPVTMRRMTRYEYNNAVSDLLKTRGDIFPLPEKPIRATTPYFDPASGHFPDAVRISNRALGKNQIEQHILTGVTPFAIDLQAEHGFNNRGTELSFSPILLESFLKLGRSILNSPEFDGYSEMTETLFAEPDTDDHDEAVSIARERLIPLLEHAFRRPPGGATTNRYVAYFGGELQRSGSFKTAMKNVVSAILSSPRFLYIIERNRTTGDGRTSTRVDPYELATRLSFFLWSTLPDRELLALARDNRLTEPDVLERQVHRMLESPKSQALSQNFARQWMRLDQLITAVPDFTRFEHYYSRIGCEQWKFGLQTMAEPLLLFESIMVEDRSIMLLVDCRYGYRTDEMVSWYADEVPFGGKQNRNRFDTFVQTFARRQMKDRREGGVITNAAIMTMTSSPLRTSPINRGAWVAGVILNKPPPPPPDVVPEIEADDAEIEAKGMTLRQRLKEHQTNQNCASCHQKIDPLGFALENYDPVGRWRDSYRSGLPIDASGILFGKAKFDDVVGLKNILLENPDWFMRAFSEHLLSYALGRELRLPDKPAVNKIVRRVREENGRFSTVVLEIVKSYPFLNKSADTVQSDETESSQ